MMGKLTVGLAAMALVFSVAAQAAQPKDPESLVHDLYQNWLASAKADLAKITNSKKALYELTAKVTDPYIDFERLARLVLGIHWRQATPAQRKAFMDAFRTHLVLTYGTAMLGYLDAKFVFKPTNYKKGDRQVIVRTQTLPGNGRAPFPVDYVLYRENSEWKAMDVIIDGISVVTTLRNIVSSEVNTKTLDGVIREIQEKNRRALR
jgi:phospholipid transport system substrate-binding protein